MIDKPSGITSHDVVAQVRRFTGIKRVGHAGTLDPLATGLLIVLVGRDETKQQQKFLSLDKVYEVELTFGADSTTDDAEGKIAVRGDPSHLTEADIEQACWQFIGEIKQRPPIYSAVHYRGERAHRLARRQAISADDLPERNVRIDRIELISWQTPHVRLRVACGHGTYIRSLARDLGAVLGVGGYVSALRRTQIGQYSVTSAVEPLKSIQIGPFPPE